MSPHNHPEPRCPVTSDLDEAQRILATGAGVGIDLSKRLIFTPEIEKELLAQVWEREFVRNGLCMLCGNSGVIDHRTKMCGDHAHIIVCGPVGQVCDGTAHCICPNGRRLKQLGHELP